MLVKRAFITITSFLSYKFELNMVGNTMALCIRRWSLCGRCGNSGLTSTTQEYSNPFNDE